MGPKAIQALDTLGRVLGLPPLALPAPTKDPLKTSTAAAPDNLGQLATAEALPSRSRCPGPPSRPYCRRAKQRRWSPRSTRVRTGGCPVVMTLAIRLEQGR